MNRHGSQRGPWPSDEEASPLTRARQVARRLWSDFDRALGRKYDLVATLRDPRARLTPEDTHRIESVLAEINEYLQDVDAQLVLAEAKVERLDV